MYLTGAVSQRLAVWAGNTSFIIWCPCGGVLRFEPIVRLALRLFKPRYTRSMGFAPFNDEKDLLRELSTYLKSHKMDLVLAFSERSTAVLCENHKILDNLAVIPYGNFNDFNLLNDKYAILEVCRKVGVPTPAFTSINDINDLIKAKELGYPLVLKCRLASGVKEAFRICRNEIELEKAFVDLTSRRSEYSYFQCDQLVAEEFIEGSIFDCGFSVNDGEVVSAVPQERLLTIPLDGGFGAYNATRDIPLLVDYGKRIFSVVKWTGPAQLEFILDRKTQAYKLIEVNPRFWGTVGLAVKSGVNIADDIIRIGLGKHPEKGLNSPRPGIAFEWLLQETLTAERLQGKKRVVWKHILRIIGSDVNNFSYSIGANVLLSLPHLMAYFSDPEKKSSTGSLAKRMFE